MNRILTKLPLLLIVCVLTQTLNAQTYKWVRGGGSTDGLSSALLMEGGYQGFYTCTDQHNNVYTVSIVGNTGPIVADTFNRPTGAFGNNQNLFFASYNCNGQMRFAKLISCAQAAPYGVVCDASGHVYLAMYTFHGSSSSTYLRLGYDTTIAGSIYGSEALLQYDTSGHFNWIRFVGDNTMSTYLGATLFTSFLAVDGMDNIHFVNSTKYGVHLTPTLTSHRGTYDLMYDAAGNLLTVNRLQLDTTLDVTSGTIDKQSNKLYAVGYRNTLFPGSMNAYIASFDISRNLIWEDTLSNPYFPNSMNFNSVVADGLGHLYAVVVSPKCIIYRGDTVMNTVGSGPSNLTAVMKLDTGGNPRWIRAYSGTSTAAGGILELTLMPNNKIAACGNTGGTLISGTDTISHYAGEGINAIFTILDSAGYIHTLQQLHGTGGDDFANGIASDNIGSLYIGGQVASHIWGGSLPPYISIGGDSDYFIMKYGVDCSCTSMPIANYAETGSATRNFTYSGTSSYPVDSVRWNFGDGTTSAATSPTHTYSSAGSFTACVTVYTSCGSDMHCDTFTVACVVAPTATYSVSGSGLAKTFAYTGVGLGTGTLSWNFGDASSTGSGSPVSHTYAAPGTYTVCVTATNTCGSNTVCTTVVVCSTPAIASYTQSGTGFVRNFTFTGSSPVAIDSVKWDFGDGNTALGTTASHTYATTDTYHVCVTVYTMCGNQTTCNDVTVAVKNIYSLLGDIKVYPNPVKSELYVTGVTENINYRIFSITGVKMQQGLLQKGSNTVSMEEFSPGIYILEMTGIDGQKNMARIVKQ